MQSPEELSKWEAEKTVMTDLEILCEYITNETGYEGDVDPDLDLLEKQILDSFSIVQWALFIQERFRIELEAEELVRDNLSSLAKVMALIDSKRSAGVGQSEKLN
jgi:acyl carrier protein